MTKEELEKEAEACMHNALFWLKLPISKENVEKGSSYILELLEPREKRIAELEAQIEKMKCCGNCKYYQFQNDAGYYTCTRDGKRNGKNYRSCEFNLEKWEGR